MKTVHCPMCNALVLHRDHPGILINQMANLGSSIFLLQDQINRLGNTKQMAAVRAPLEARLALLEDHLKRLKEFRDAPEESGTEVEGYPV